MIKASALWGMLAVCWSLSASANRYQPALRGKVRPGTGVLGEALARHITETPHRGHNGVLRVRHDFAQGGLLQEYNKTQYSRAGDIAFSLPVRAADGAEGFMLTHCDVRGSTTVSTTLKSPSRNYYVLQDPAGEVFGMSNPDLIHVLHGNLAVIRTTADWFSQLRLIEERLSVPAKAFIDDVRGTAASSLPHPTDIRSIAIDVLNR